jgi:acetoacetyl-CoA reductase
MKKIAFFGATGGLGTKILPYLADYRVDSISSIKVNFEVEGDIAGYFSTNSDIDILLIFTNYNHNALLHTYAYKLPELSKQVQINIQGVSECISNALFQMRKNNYGRIIIASSILVDKGVIGTGVYSASKAYYENIVKTIALENATKGITANCIQLGYMDGGLTNTLDSNFMEKIIQDIPTKRLGTAKEIANTISFLIDNEYVNGTTIKLTGGL